MFVSAGALALQTSSFPLTDDQFLSAEVQAVTSVNCSGSEDWLHDCSWTVANLQTDDRCTSDRVAEVVCQGTCTYYHKLVIVSMCSFIRILSALVSDFVSDVNNVCIYLTHEAEQHYNILQTSL